MIMRKHFALVFFLFLSMVTYRIHAQSSEQAEPDTTPDNVLLEKHWSIGVQLNTNGWGLKFSKGRNITALKQFLWEIEFSSYKEAKEVKTINPYFSNSKSYIYGKLNYVYFLRGGVGFQHILNRKPYWGGVQVSCHYYGGFSLGITKPVYLYIIRITSPQGDTYDITEEKYNPDIHYIENIYGRASFLTGITRITPYPEIYVKTGLNFEFGARSKSMKLLEAGATLDYSPIPIPIMAYNPKRSLFLTLYIAFGLGKRYN
jgi:hypothetical protein